MVTKKVLQGVICGAEVWRIVETEIISFSRADHHLTETQKEANTRFDSLNFDCGFYSFYLETSKRGNVFNL